LISVRPTTDEATRRPGRRQPLTRADAPAWCEAGRWGPRRVRVSECAVVCAEDVYTGLLDDNPAALRPGASGAVARTVGGCDLALAWDCRPNAVWRFGRVFLHCPRCERRATRLYLPTATAELACRRCLGLTYESQQRRNYKGGAPFARWLTLGDRTRRAEASARRWADRRAILKAHRPTSS
jgi:hypothetical protein